MARSTLALLLLATACSGSRSQIEIGPVPARETTGVLAGPMCQGDQCTCAKTAAEAGTPAGNHKRFEVRLASAQELWATLPGHRLYKSPERAEACFYVDLAPGQHPIALRASDPNGVSAELEIRELGAAGKTKYQTFRFSCGHPGVCSFEDLDAAKVSYKAFQRGLHDPCGSTKIKGLSWDHGKAPDGAHPNELLVHVTLDVYTFQPEKPSGDPTCGPGDGARSKRDAAEPGPDDGDPAPADDGGEAP